MTISGIVGREVLDSRGNPTVEATVTLSNGLSAQAMVPSGASTGAYEAVELRDNDANRYGGNGVLQAVSNINSVLAPQLIGLCPDDLSMIDSTMIAIDGTPEKGNLGANAILALSMATARVISEANGHNDSLWEFLSCGNPVTLPVPMLNILNGGRHASNSTDIQEFMVLPIGFDTFSEALRCGVEIYQSLKNILTMLLMPYCLQI